MWLLSDHILRLYENQWHREGTCHMHILLHGQMWPLPISGRGIKTVLHSTTQTNCYAKIYTNSKTYKKNQSRNKNKHLPAGVYNSAQACFSNIPTPAQWQVTKIGTTADQQYTWQQTETDAFNFQILSAFKFRVSVLLILTVDAICNKKQQTCSVLVIG